MQNGSLAAHSGTFMLNGETPVFRLGFGAMRITGPGIWGPPRDREEAKRVLRRALDLGVNFIDTADSYGPHVSEELIAEALHPYPDGLIIATKGGYTRSGPDQWHSNIRPDYLREALDGSLSRLRTDTIDLYQLHNPGRGGDQEIADAIGVLTDAQRQGKIRYIGVSNVSVRQLEHMRSLATIVTVQNRYNLADRHSEDVLDVCDREGIGFIPWFPLATGELARPGGTLDTLSHQLNAAPSQIALAWLLHRSPVMLPIPGTGSVEHLEENLQAADVQLTDEAFNSLN